MAEIHTILLYSLLMLVITAIEIFRKRSAPYDMLFLINLSYLIYFVVAPLHVILGGKDFQRSNIIYSSVGPGDFEIAVWIFLSYLLIVSGYAIAPNVRKLRLTEGISDNIWLWTAIASAAMGATALIVFGLTAVGDVVSVVTQAIFIRSGITQVESDALFVKHFVPLMISAFTIVAALLIGAHKRYKAPLFRTKLIFFLVIFGILALISVLTMAGRRNLIFPLIVLFFLWSNLRGRWNVKIGMIFVLLFMLYLTFWQVGQWLLAGYLNVGYLEALGDFGSIYAKAFSALSDSYMHTVGMLNSMPSYWGFIDLLLQPFYLIPESVLGDLAPTSLSVETTETLGGQGVHRIAEEPPGFHGYFYGSAGYPGIIIGSLLFGFIARILHNAFTPSCKNALSWMVYIWVCLAYVYFIRHGLMEFTINERFHWLATMFILFAVTMVFQGLRATRANLKHT